MNGDTIPVKLSLNVAEFRSLLVNEGGALRDLETPAHIEIPMEDVVERLEEAA
jgi:hypothetical protein